MTGTLLGTIGVLGAALITAVFTYLGVRRSARAQASQAATERELGLIDRWKSFADEAEERADRIEQRVNAKIAAQDAAIADLRRRLSCLEAREKVLRDYAHQLRMHIERELGPPAPPWPDDVNKPSH